MHCTSNTPLLKTGIFGGLPFDRHGHFVYLSILCLLTWEIFSRAVRSLALLRRHIGDPATPTTTTHASPAKRADRLAEFRLRTRIGMVKG